jgi:HD-GYP domain-containing protein (c-di-GMP phosphodiesterase class II)
LISSKQNTPNSGAGLPVKKVHYEDTASVEDEITFARECHTDLSETMDSIITDVKAGNRINLNKAKKSVTQMIDSVARNPDAFMWLTKLKDTDSYTYHHAMDVSILAVTLGRHLGLSKNELKDLAIGSLLFDIGKVKLPDNILNKPGRLTDEEFELVKKHVDYSVEIMKGIKGMPARAIEIGRFHHERHNGNGYPHGVKGTEIPVFARIAAIVDCYDAITSDRTYSRAISSHEAIKQLYEWGNIDFQIELIEQFIQCLGIYPTGSLIELSSGQVGVILSQNRVRRLRPKVMLILDPHKVAYEHFPVLDLAVETEDKDGNALDIVATHEPGAFGIDPKTFYL